MTRARIARGLEALLLFGLGAVPCTITWTVAGMHLAYGLAAAAALALGLGWRRWRLRRTPADGAMAAFAVASLLATWRSVDPAASWIGLKKLLLIPLVHLAAGGLATPVRARWGLRLFVGAIAVTAVAATLHFVLVPHAADARLRTTGHYMTFAGLLLLGAAVGAAAAVVCRGRMRVLYGLGFGACALGLGLTFTRSAWLGMFVAAAAMLLRSQPRRAWILIPAVVVGFVLLPPAYRDRARSSFDPTHPNNLDRLRMWRAGAEIWRAHPITGVGLVDLAPLVRQYRQTSAGQVHGHMHDNWIQILVTTGSLGFLAFAWLMFGLGRTAWHAGRAGPPPELRGLGLGIWGAYCGFQVMGLFEWNFGDVEVTIALYFLLGAGLAAAGASAAAGGVAAGPGSTGTAGRVEGAISGMSS